MNIDAFLKTLPIMLYGMAGIFTVIIMIYIVIFILGKIKFKEQ